MNLYERDYNAMTGEEEAEWKAVIKKHTTHFRKLEVRSDSIHDWPKAARHFNSLFPNNYLDIGELQDTEKTTASLADFNKLLNSPEVKEQDLLAFVRDTQSYFLVGSILDRFTFGHHGAFLFREFPLGTSYQVDFLLVGQGSGGWEFVFVEFEAPTDDAVLKEGDLGKAFRAGTKQIQRWREWLQANYANLREVFDKYKKPGESLPSEFITLDMSRLHFAVVAGRRKDFQDRTYRLGREKSDEVVLLHYDNLFSYTTNCIRRQAY